MAAGTKITQAFVRSIRVRCGLRPPDTVSSVLVVTRYRVSPADAEEFRALAREALRALAGRPGCLGGTVGRNADDAGLWVLATSWSSVGAYRRALSDYHVKLHAVPLMYRAVDEPTAFEMVFSAAGGGSVEEHLVSRADDADTVNLGEAAGPGATHWGG